MPRAMPLPQACTAPCPRGLSWAYASLQWEEGSPGMTSSHPAPWLVCGSPYSGFTPMCERDESQRDLQGSLTGNYDWNGEGRFHQLVLDPRFHQLQLESKEAHNQPWILVNWFYQQSLSSSGFVYLKNRSMALSDPRIWHGEICLNLGPQMKSFARSRASSAHIQAEELSLSLTCCGSWLPIPPNQKTYLGKVKQLPEVEFLNSLRQEPKTENVALSPIWQEGLMRNCN